MFGTGGDAKGQPTQTNSISHGSPWLRIKKILVGAAYAWSAAPIRCNGEPRSSRRTRRSRRRRRRNAEPAEPAEATRDGSAKRAAPR